MALSTRWLGMVLALQDCDPGQGHNPAYAEQGMISVEAKQKAELSSRRGTNAAVSGPCQMGKGNRHSAVLSNPRGCGKRLESTEEV